MNRIAASAKRRLFSVRSVYISTDYRNNKENPTIFGGDDMEFETKRKLVDIAPLLERLDRGEILADEEQVQNVLVFFCKVGAELCPVHIFRIQKLQNHFLWGIRFRQRGAAPFNSY